MVTSVKDLSRAVLYRILDDKIIFIGYFNPDDAIKEDGDTNCFNLTTNWSMPLTEFKKFNYNSDKAYIRYNEGAEQFSLSPLTEKTLIKQVFSMFLRRDFDSFKNQIPCPGLYYSLREPIVMKDHHDYPKEFIGCSDISILTFVGLDDLSHVKASAITYGGDGDYLAYIVDEKCEIPSHYTLVGKFRQWLKIYDDAGLSYKLSDAGYTYYVYRAASFGTIIQKCKDAA